MDENNQYLNPWTKKEIDFLKENYKNIKYKAIAKELGKSCSAIFGKAFRLGLKSCRREYKKGYKPWNRGLTKKTNESIKSTSLKLRGRKLSEETKNKIKEKCKGKFKHIIPKKQLYELYINQKLPMGEISKKLKVSTSCINKRLRMFKIPLNTISEVRKYLFKTGKLKLSPKAGFQKGHKVPKEWRDNLSKTKKDKPNPKLSNIFKKLYKEGKMKGGFQKGHPQYNTGRTHFKKGDPELIRRCKKMRAKLILPVKDTKIEVKIQNFLKQLGIEFFTHQYMSEIKHSYQCDVLIPCMNLVIECDGDYFHANPKKYKPNNKIFKNGMTAKERWMLDYMRTNELKEKGYVVLRLWESDIKKMDVNDFKNKIQRFDE